MLTKSTLSRLSSSAVKPDSKPGPLNKQSTGSVPATNVSASFDSGLKNLQPDKKPYVGHNVSVSKNVGRV